MLNRPFYLKGKTDVFKTNSFLCFYTKGKTDVLKAFNLTFPIKRKMRRFCPLSHYLLVLIKTILLEPSLNKSCSSETV